MMAGNSARSSLLNENDRSDLNKRSGSVSGFCWYVCDDPSLLPRDGVLMLLL